MRIGAAEAERADARPPGRSIAGSRPGERSVGDAQRAAGEIDQRIGCAIMDRRRNDPVTQRLHGLDQARHAGGRFQMADIRFHRPDRAASRRPATQPAEHRLQSFDFHGVAELRAGAVRFDHAEGCGGNARIGDGGFDDIGLGQGVRCGDGLRVSAMPDRRTADHRQHGVAVRQRGVQRLQHDGRHALTLDVTIRSGIEHAAASVRRTHAEALHGFLGIGAEHQADAAGHREFRLPMPQRQYRSV